MANINTTIGHGEVDRVEAQRDEYTKDGMTVRESVGIAMEQAMSKVFKSGRDSLSGFGPGAMQGHGRKDMTVEEFLQTDPKRREAANGVRDRVGYARSPERTRD